MMDIDQQDKDQLLGRLATSTRSPYGQFKGG